MAQLIPASWRQALARLRDDIQSALERWLPKRQAEETHAELMPLNGPLWISSSFLEGSPALDMEETDDALIVVADLPGLERDDFTVEITGQRLVIRGEQKRSAERRGRNYYYAERSYGTFARALPLPCEIDPDKAHATYKHGVLRITLPKTARAKATQVHITVHEGA
jgi:HSP20 family protein